MTMPRGRGDVVLAADVGLPAAASLGVLAGLVLLVAELLLSALAGGGLATPLRYAGSVVLGEDALERTGALAVVLGLLVHLAISAGWGWVYGAVHRALSPRTQVAPARQAIGGLLFGLAVWAIDLHVVARGLYPWFLALPQGAQAVVHAAFYGAPLGVLFAAAAARPEPLRPAPAAP